MSDFWNFVAPNTLNIIYGPPGAGRSTLLLQTTNECRTLPTPLPFALISAVQSQDELRAHLYALGYDPSLFPHASLLQGHKREDYTIEGAIRLARTLVPTLQVLFIDGLTALCPGNIAIYREAANFLATIQTWGLQHNLTIIGTVSCGKGEELDVRHRPLGSAAWNDFTSTRFIIDYAKPGKLDDPGRTIQIIPRRSPITFRRYILDPQTLLLTHDESSEVGLQKELDAWLEIQQPGVSLTTEDIKIAGLQLGLSRATIFRWVQSAVELGMLVRLKHGIYTRAPIPTVQDLQ